MIINSIKSIQLGSYWLYPVCILTFGYEIQFLLQVINVSFINFIRNYSYHNIIKELEEQIFNNIASLRISKKQPNEDIIYCIISKTETKTYSHLIIRLPYHKITLKYQKREPL